MNQSLSLATLVSRFLLSRRNLSPRTQDYYHNILGKFLWYADSHGWPPLEAITRHHLRDFVNYVATEDHRWLEGSRSSAKRASPATIHHYGQAVKTLFTWAEAEEYLDPNPALRLKLGSAGYKEVEPYTDDEVTAMLGVCDYDADRGYRYLGIRNKAIVSLLVATGVRLSELAGINLDDFDPKLQQVQVVGKGSKPRAVPVDGEARKALRRYLQTRQGGGELWQTSSGQPMTMYGIKIMLRRLKRRAGVNSGGGAHRFRHYFATAYLEAGGDLNNLRLLLGHSTLAMVLKYSRFVDIQKALAGHEQFSPLDRLYRNNHSRGWGYGHRG